MEALIRAEAVASAAASAAAAAGGSRAALPAKRKKARPVKASTTGSGAAPEPKAAAPKTHSGGGVRYDEDEDEDEEDEDFHDHGYFVPQQVADPTSAAEVAAATGRRAFFEGVPGRAELSGRGATVIGWLRGKKCWEVESDVRDERLLVRSSNLMWMATTAVEHAPGPKRKPSSSKQVREAAAGKPRAKPAKRPRAGRG